MRGGLDTRLRRLAAEAAHAVEAQGNGRDAAAAHAAITEFLNAVRAEKAAGDVQGIASRQIAAVVAELERQA